MIEFSSQGTLFFELGCNLLCQQNASSLSERATFCPVEQKMKYFETDILAVKLSKTFVRIFFSYLESCFLCIFLTSVYFLFFETKIVRSNVNTGLLLKLNLVLTEVGIGQESYYIFIYKCHLFTVILIWIVFTFVFKKSFNDMKPRNEKYLCIIIAKYSIYCV